ncbi:MAG: DinB family protein [Aggregatilineales bacterium]
MSTVSKVNSKSEIVSALQTICDELAGKISAMSEESFSEERGAMWSRADYVKHLILANKPFAKGLTLPHEQLNQMFGTPDHTPMSYEELVDKYESKLATGVGAEDNPPVVPVNYRFPDGVTDVKAYLQETLVDANNRIITALENWTDDALDQYQLPHPAVGMLTMREMLFFTVHHNRAHSKDLD